MASWRTRGEALFLRHLPLRIRLLGRSHVSHTHRRLASEARTILPRRVRRLRSTRPHDRGIRRRCPSTASPSGADMTKKLPPDAFHYYVGLGVNRSYQAVAEKYGVSKRAVTSRAVQEDWQGRVVSLCARARSRPGSAMAVTHVAPYEAYTRARWQSPPLARGSARAPSRAPQQRTGQGSSSS